MELSQFRSQDSEEMSNVKREEDDADKVDVAFQPRRAMSRQDNEDEQPENLTPDAEGANKLAGMLDANVYATKKTIAQGMLDVALLTANASQLKYLLQVGTAHEFYYLMMSLICISIILQLLAGVAIFFTASYNINEEKSAPKADRLNDLTTIGVFLIVAINIFISAFGMAEWPSEPSPTTRDGIDNQIRGFNNTDQQMFNATTA